MAPRFARRLSALLLTLALAVGFAVHGVQAAHMSAKMAAASMAAATPDTPMPDGCGGCDDDGKAPAVCSAVCAGVVAVLPVLVTVRALDIAPRYSPVTDGGAGLRGPPDPFPPRPSVLI